jgi:hypothetical protein
MKKQLSSFALALSLIPISSAFAQDQRIQPCVTYAAMEDHFARDPQAAINYQALEKILNTQMQENAANGAKSAAAFEYTIPVVFHILHTGGSENVSDASCISVLNWVNKDLARMNSDTGTIAAPYKPLYVPSDIKLMLAKKDKDGNCVSGIVHRYDARTVWDRSGDLNVLYSGITTSYPSDMYLNIIIVKEIVAEPGQQGIVVGYTYKPGSWGVKAPQDAIVYIYSHLGGSQARSMTHELGHWLGLDHTFGQTNNPGVVCGDDGLGDTPPTKGNFGMCPSSLTGNTCAGSGGKTNVENIMDYSTCPKNFTVDQTNLMRSRLQNHARRIKHWSSQNLIDTDINGVGLCKPVAEFLSSNFVYTVCAGGSLTMQDFSYNGTIATYNWLADNNAVIAADNASVTNITFPTVGQVNVILTVGNGQGTSSKTRTVLVLDGTPGITGPHLEGFEDLALPAGWIVWNGNNGSPTFQRTESAAYEGTACFYMNTSNSNGNNEDYVQTPIMDMQNSAVQTLEFAYAYARQSTAHNDKFRVEGSNDCGGSFLPIIELASNQMQLNSGGVQTAPFYPAVIEEWKTIDLATYPGAKWAPFKNSPNVIVRFRFIQGTTGNGNNFFLDAINLPVSTVGINELKKDLKFKLFPNPTDGSATVKFSLHDATSVDVTVVDILGKVIYTSSGSTFNPGDHSIQLNSDHKLAPGIYNVNVKLNGTNVTSKLVVQ